MLRVYGFCLSVFFSFRWYVRSFVRYYVTLTKITSKFCFKVSQRVYLNNHSSESIHIWAMGTLDGLLRSMNFGPRVHAPGWGWMSKSRTPLKGVILLFLLCFPLLKILGQISVIHMAQPFVS